MGFKIEDGTGGGHYCKVDDENRITTLAITRNEDQEINIDHNKAWSIPFKDLNPTGADDYVVYIKNTGDATLHISDIRIAASAATQIEVNAVTGTASGGTSVTLVSRTVGAAVVPTATIEIGTDIAGLTSAGTLFFIQCPTVDKQEHLSISSRLRIPKGKAVALLVENGSANVTGVVSLIEEV